MRRNALTLVEVLVVLIVIGVIICLVLPAIQASRETGGGRQCSNQVRQLLLGCWYYESAVQRFPLAMSGKMASDKIDTQGPSPMVGADGYSFLVPLLSYIEETALADEIYAASNDLSEPINSSNFAASEGHLFDRPLEVALCPNFPSEEYALGDYGPVKPQASHYHAMVAGCAKDTDQTFADVDPRTGGVLVTKQAAAKGMKMMDVTDGTSQTLLISESRAEVWTAWFSGASVSTIAFSPQVASCSDFLDSTKSVADIPLGLNYGSSDETKSFWIRDNEKRDWGPSSAHPGGAVMSGFADGHVKPLDNSISARVYFQLSTRGGE